MVCGITGVGAYVPRLRIERSAIAAAHAWMAPGLKGQAKGTRAFCSWDEDAITMAVEAARDCLTGQDRQSIRSVHLASTTFPYADLSNGVIVASALGLESDISVSNLAGSQRAATTALVEALRTGKENALIIASERPVALPASMAEIQGGAGAVALRLGTSGVIAYLRAARSRMAHFVDHFRSAENVADYSWEERWIRDEGYAKLVPAVASEAMAEAGVQGSEIAHFIMPSALRGVAATLARQLGVTGRIAGEFEPQVGYCGAAHAFLMLAEVLEIAQPGETILMIGFGQGVDALVLEATGAGLQLGSRGLSGAIADGLMTQDYLRMLSFNDQIALDWGMRGEKSGKAALTEHYRVAHQVDTFTGGRCGNCGEVQFPVMSYCANPECSVPLLGCEPVVLAEEQGKIFTVTSDGLSYHPAPPLVVGFVQFDIGARVLMEMVEMAPSQVNHGTRLRMVFRIKERDKVRGYNRYFWKAMPVDGAMEAADG